MEKETTPKIEEKKVEPTKVVEPAKEKKVESKIEKPKKGEAVAKSLSIPVSKKHSMFIGRFIKGKNIDLAISQLEEVIILKRAIPYTGEIPHRKGKMMSGRYPVNASKAFIYLLKALKGNAAANGLDLEKTVISSCSASWASRPSKRGGSAAKRTNVILTAKEVNKKPKEKKK